MASSFGKMPATLVRRLISLLRRSIGFVLRSLGRKDRHAADGAQDPRPKVARISRQILVPHRIRSGPKASASRPDRRHRSMARHRPTQAQAGQNRVACRSPLRNHQAIVIARISRLDGCMKLNPSGVSGSIFDPFAVAVAMATKARPISFRQGENGRKQDGKALSAGLSAVVVHDAEPQNRSPGGSFRDLRS